MSYCASCGAAIPTGGTFCGQCGHRVGNPLPDATNASPVATPAAPVAAVVPPTVALGPTPTPPPPPSTRRSPAAAVFGVLALAAVGAGILIFATRDDKKSTSTDGNGLATTTVVDGASTSTSEAGSTLPATTVSADPSVQLQQLVAGDRPTADTLVGKFVVQLSAKKLGLVVNGLTFGPAEIRDDHLKLRSAYGAILVDAGAFQFTAGGQPMTGWYLTIVPTAFPTKAAADQWCTSHGLPAGDCFSRQFKPPA